MNQDKMKICFLFSNYDRINIINHSKVIYFFLFLLDLHPDIQLTRPLNSLNLNIITFTYITWVGVGITNTFSNIKNNYVQNVINKIYIYVDSKLLK